MKRSLQFLMAGCIAAVCILLLPESVYAADEVNILFIHDLHSHLEGYDDNVDGADVHIGGAPALKAMMDKERSLYPDTLTVDAGDFSMGTLYQTVFSEEATELRTLGQIGVEATTIGNHEFDFRGRGFYDMFEAALASGDKLPYFILSNVDWDSMKAAGLTEEQQLYYDCFNDYGVKDYVIIEKGSMRIALFGLFGRDALNNAPTCALLFKDPVEAAKETVAKIKSEEAPDMIVCLSHCGTDNDGISEDGEIAEAVGDIDLIVSGHSHRILEEPLVYGNTTIVSSGSYGRHLGKILLMRTKEGRWKTKEYRLDLVTDAEGSDPEVIASLENYTKRIDSDYMSLFGYSKNQVLAHNDIEFDTVRDCYNIHTEHNLGDIIADGFMYSSDNAEEGDDPVDVAVCASGCIRTSFVPGDITAEKAYNCYSLGIGPDGRSGYPLIHLYLTGEELMTVCEIDASMSDLMDVARLYMNGLEFTFNPNRVLLNRVTEAHLVDKDGNPCEIDKDRLYRVVCDLYMGQMLASVTDKSHGLISLVPKYADGTPVEDYEDIIFYRNGEELKAWQAVADYMNSFEKGDDGIGSVPGYYRESIHGRKAVEAGFSPVSLFKNTNRIGMVIYAVMILLVILVVFIILRVVRRIKR